ncbi:MAG: hypothetical protein RL419_1342, partial [Actinomycetota bacterium]
QFSPNYGNAEMFEPSSGAATEQLGRLVEMSAASAIQPAR